MKTLDCGHGPSPHKKMKVTVFRTAMAGGGLSYDVYVKRADAGQPDQHTTIIRDLHGSRIEWLNYPDATIDPAHWSLPQGDRKSVV